MTHPHITISLNPGTKSSYGNTLVARGYKKVMGPTLDAVLVIDQ